MLGNSAPIGMTRTVPTFIKPDHDLNFRVPQLHCAVTGCFPLVKYPGNIIFP